MDFRLDRVISNPDSLPLRVPEVCFSPSGERVAVSYGFSRRRSGEKRNSGRVVIYDCATGQELQSIRNDDIEHDFPHGVLLLDDRLVVSYKLKHQPGYLGVYALGKAGHELLSVFHPPFPHLHEIHSLAFHGKLLAASFCENVASTGAVAMFAFDSAKGVVGPVLSLEEELFRELGDPKGVAFSEDGGKLYVTYESDEGSGLGNGVVTLPLSAPGVFAPRQATVLPRDEFCRLENISIAAGLCALADTVNNRIHIHDLQRDPHLQAPLQQLSLEDSNPHGVKLSPDGRRLVVSGLAHQLKGTRIDWQSWLTGRGDNVYIFSRSEAD